MSILTSLAKAYERLPDAPPFGYSSERIQFCISLDPNGSIVGRPFAFEYDRKGKPAARNIDVPYFGGRSGSNAPPYFLWDNSAYVLGVSSKEGFDAEKRFEAFRRFHLDALREARSNSLRALVSFLSEWKPNHFKYFGFSDEILDKNIVFKLSNEIEYIHESKEAGEIWGGIYKPDVVGERVCLISGTRQPIARLHPPIKTFDNPARIVSFDKDNDAFSSYGHLFAENAPTGVRAAFAYTAVINRFLASDSGHRIQIGDASTVFWADAENIELAQEAEGFFSSLLDASDLHAEEELATRQVGEKLERIRRGEPLRDVEPRLAEGVRFFVLGLAPNAARLSVRFYFEESFGKLTENYQSFLHDMAIEPPPKGDFPPLWHYLRETAVLGKRENIAPNLAGEWMRSILTGGRYPLTLLSAVLTRIRADGEINALRVGILKAVLVRNFKREALVALDPDNTNRGYLLGRLFATYEQAQTAALGTRVNATIKDKFYGSASAQPRKVFPMLESGSQNHLSKIGKQSPGRRVNLEKQIAAIMEMMDPAGDPFPASFSAEEQALFGLGYYHQRNDFFKKHTDDSKAGEA